MPKRVNSSVSTAFVPMVPTVFFVSAAFAVAATITSSIYNAAQADSPCIEQPNQPAPEGARWQSRYDRAKGRKCWFLSDAATGTRDVTTSQVQSSAASEPSLSSRLSELFGSLTGSSPNVAPEGNATGAPRKHQGTPANAAKTDNRVRADQRDLVEAHAGKRTQPALTEPERNALFEEFLQWHENQESTVRLRPSSPSQ